MDTEQQRPNSRWCFRSAFQSLTGYQPYPWQEKLFTEFIAKPFAPPSNINLPTGTGKTAIMAVWLLAAAHQAENSLSNLVVPRRLVWVVNRRVVVDQATDEAEMLARNLEKPEMISVRSTLLRISGNNDSIPLSISTLRGEREDNRSWSRNPARAAIVVGTVDMIGSRLLFSGYGDGPYWRAQHAGLLGLDALIVNDEAHLTPAFAKLIEDIEKTQQRYPGEHLKPFRTIRLSATHSSSRCWPESLDEDRMVPQFRAVFEARKGLELLVLPALKFHPRMLELATQPGPARTLIYLRRPEDVIKTAAAIRNRLGQAAHDRVIVITGTMRGFERDLLVMKPSFRAFTSHIPPADSYWLLATSAGEVGINITSDRLITDLDTVDHIIQRLGRLNRFGETDGKAFLLATETQVKQGTGKPHGERLKAAFSFLNSLSKRGDGLIDASPEALFGVVIPAAAVSETPVVPLLHSNQIDAWSQTSLGKHPARLAVEPWLHGDAKDLPETYIAWRSDVPFLAQVDDSDDMAEALRKHRVLAHEKLREPTKEFVEHKLKPLLQSADNEFSILRQKPDGTVDVIDRSWFLQRIEGSDLQDELSYCLLLLPLGFGQIAGGIFLPVWTRGDRTTEHTGVAYDISAQTLVREQDSVESLENRRSFLATRTQNGDWELSRLNGVAEQTYDQEFIPSLTMKDLRPFAERDSFQFKFMAPLRIDDAEQPQAALLYFARSSLEKPPSRICPLDRHGKDVRSKAKSLSEALALNPMLGEALVLAGELHDLGKAETIWQRAAGNIEADGSYGAAEAVAKSLEPLRWKELLGFRHELASLILSEDYLKHRNVDESVLELALHLVATHHGRARAFFEAKAYDRRHLHKSQRAAQRSIERFAAFHKRFGPWGLAYLEAILRAADGMASAGWEDRTNA